MNKKIYFVILSILIISLPVNIFGIYAAKVSLKYETNNPGDCISTISGTNLCDFIFNMKIMIVVAIFVIFFLLYFKNKILKTQQQ